MLAVELLKLRPDLPVILCTGYSENVSRETDMAERENERNTIICGFIGILVFIFIPVAQAEQPLDKEVTSFGGSVKECVPAPVEEA
jgi:hypothetical protein